MRYDPQRSVILVLIVAFAAADMAAQPRTCVRADVEEPFLLPDGSVHPAGLLRICIDRDYSPVAGLHSIAAGDGARGIFLSRRIKAEGVTNGSPRLAFVRDVAGILVFRGYTLQRRGRMETYWLKVPEALVVQTAPALGTIWLAAVEGR